MNSKLWQFIGGAMVSGIALLSLPRTGTAQESANPLPAGSRAALGAPQNVDSDLRARIERLEKQNEELMRALQGATSHVSADGSPASAGVGKDEVQKIVSDYMAARDAAVQAAPKGADSADGYRVGSDLGAGASWNKDGYLWIYTANKDFTMHPGFWLQYDNVFWDQSSALTKAQGARSGPKQGVASGASQAGIGDLEDGTYFRRIRPFLEGTLWETYEYRLNLALENNQYSTTGLDEVWVGANQIPVVGTVRVGHVKNANGFEADMTGSSRTMTFLERSSYSEVIELNENFVTGVWASNNFLDQHMTYTATLFRQDQAAASGAYFGDGQYGAEGRLTFLPLYECEGRSWLHMGVSGGWRNGANNLATSPDRTFQFRARPELRDDDPAGSPSGAQVVPNANSNRMIDTGAIAAQEDYLLGLELCYVRGPFSVQAEYGWNFLDGAYGVAPSGFTLNPPIVPRQNYTFSGGYVQLAYTLTGESRAYDRKYGVLARNYFNEGNITNAWAVRDENGRLNWGWGAWELAARYSYVNLNDGTGTTRIQGGVMDGFTVGLNWYLNNNIKLQFDWVYDHRYDVPVGVIPGYTSGFGTRMQLSF